jgi:hypothetical protein
MHANGWVPNRTATNVRCRGSSHRLRGPVILAPSQHFHRSLLRGADISVRSTCCYKSQLLLSAPPRGFGTHLSIFWTLPYVDNHCLQHLQNRLSVWVEDAWQRDLWSLLIALASGMARPSGGCARSWKPMAVNAWTTNLLELPHKM